MYVSSEVEARVSWMSLILKFRDFSTHQNLRNIFMSWRITRRIICISQKFASNLTAMYDTVMELKDELCVSKSKTARVLNFFIISVRKMPVGFMLPDIYFWEKKYSNLQDKSPI